MLKYDENGLITAVVQDVQGRVLMIASMNEEAFDKTLQTGETWFYDKEKAKIYNKGAQTGAVQKVRRITADCNRSSILVIVDQYGSGACKHKSGEYSCYHNLIMSEGLEPSDFQPKRDALSWLYATIEDRRRSPKVGSYTNYLMENGLDKILTSVGEEAVETIIAAKSNGNEELIYEVSDLLYHLLVLLVFRKISLDDIWEELLGRSGVSDS